MLKSYLLEIESKVIYMECEYLGDIDRETKEPLFKLDKEKYLELEGNIDFLRRLESEVGVEITMCLKSLTSLKKAIRTSIDNRSYVV